MTTLRNLAEWSLMAVLIYGLYGWLVCGGIV